MPKQRQIDAQRPEERHPVKSLNHLWQQIVPGALVPPGTRLRQRDPKYLRGQVVDVPSDRLPESSAVQ